MFQTFRSQSEMIELCMDRLRVSPEQVPSALQVVILEKLIAGLLESVNIETNFCLVLLYYCNTLGFECLEH